MVKIKFLTIAHFEKPFDNMAKPTKREIIEIIKTNDVSSEALDYIWKKKGLKDFKAALSLLSTKRNKKVQDAHIPT